MNRKEAMELWREVVGEPPNMPPTGRIIELFANRVATKEREACAKICEEQAERSWAVEDGALVCAEAIRTLTPNACGQATSEASSPAPDCSASAAKEE